MRQDLALIEHPSFDTSERDGSRRYRYLGLLLVLLLFGGLGGWSALAELNGADRKSVV